MFRAGFLLALSITILGCGEAGPELAAVTGKLTKGGKPLAGVNVTFSPIEPGPSSGGRTDSDGKFVLLSQSGKAGAVPGKHKVVLAVPAATVGAGGSTDPMAGRDAMMKQRESAMANNQQGRPVEDAAAAAAAAMFQPEYSDGAKTPLEYTVVSGANDFDIVIP